MKKNALLIAFSAFALAACSSVPAAPPTAESADLTTLAPADEDVAVTLRRTLADLVAARAAAGELGAQTKDASGEAIDLDALIAQYEGHLVTAQSATLPETLLAQDAYVTNFRTIVADDRFRVNYYNWKRGFPGYNWSNDGCSGPAKYTGYADNFVWPCIQHDFGYRNNRRAGQHNESTRLFIDVQFLQHMNQLCGTYGLLARPGCYAAANVFYNGVRFGGWSAFY